VVRLTEVLVWLVDRVHSDAGADHDRRGREHQPPEDSFLSVPGAPPSGVHRNVSRLHHFLH
jgi:hypothetical protein